MKTIFFEEVKRTRISMMIWSIFIGLIAYFGILEYPVLAPYTALMEETLSLIPKIAQLIFGVYNVSLTEPLGYYAVMYYWTGLIIFVHAIYIGASIISKESRDSTAEFIFTKPYKRSIIVWAKIFAGFVNILVVGAVATALSIMAVTPVINDFTAYRQIFICCVGMFLTQCVLMSLGLLCSAFFKTYKSGVMGAMLVLIASYALMFFVQYIEMPVFYFLSPLTFFEVSQVISSGLRLTYIGLSVIVVAVCCYFTQHLYNKKEII